MQEMCWSDVHMYVWSVLVDTCTYMYVATNVAHLQLRLHTSK